MSKKTKAVLGGDTLDVVADRGYFASEQILECAQADVTVTLPKPQTSGGKAQSRFVKADFRYVADHDLYVCPSDALLMFVSHKRESDGLNLRRYSGEASYVSVDGHVVATNNEPGVGTLWQRHWRLVAAGLTSGLLDKAVTFDKLADAVMDVLADAAALRARLAGLDQRAEVDGYVNRRFCE